VGNRRSQKSFLLAPTRIMNSVFKRKRAGRRAFGTGELRRLGETWDSMACALGAKLLGNKKTFPIQIELGPWRVGSIKRRRSEVAGHGAPLSASHCLELKGVSRKNRETGGNIDSKSFGKEGVQGV